MNTYIHAYLYVYTYIHTYVRTYIHPYMHTYILTYIHTYTIHTKHRYKFTYIHSCIYIYIYTHVCVCANVCSEPKEEYLHVCEGLELSRLEDLSTVRFQDCKILGTGARCEGDLWNPNKYTVNQIQNQINKE